MFDFPTRQETAVYTIAKELKHFRDFVPRYVKDRVFLEATIATKDDSYHQIREDDPGFRKFVHQQPGEIMCALEKERAEKAVFFNIAVVCPYKPHLSVRCLVPHSAQVNLANVGERGGGSTSTSKVG